MKLVAVSMEPAMIDGGTPRTDMRGSGRMVKLRSAIGEKCIASVPDKANLHWTVPAASDEEETKEVVCAAVVVEVSTDSF